MSLIEQAKNNIFLDTHKNPLPSIHQAEAKVPEKKVAPSLCSKERFQLKQEPHIDLS